LALPLRLSRLSTLTVCLVGHTRGFPRSALGFLSALLLGLMSTACLGLPPLLLYQSLALGVRSLLLPLILACSLLAGLGVLSRTAAALGLSPLLQRSACPTLPATITLTALSGHFDGRASTSWQCGQGKTLGRLLHFDLDAANSRLISGATQDKRPTTGML